MTDIIDVLKTKIDILYKENVRRREAIEKHKRTMREEKIMDYYFDRELWSVLEDVDEAILQEL